MWSTWGALLQLFNFAAARGGSVQVWSQVSKKEEKIRIIIMGGEKKHFPPNDFTNVWFNSFLMLSFWEPIDCQVIISSNLTILWSHFLICLNHFLHFFALNIGIYKASNLFYINIILPPNWLCLPSNIWTNKQLWNEFPFQIRYWIIGINGIYQVSVLVDLSSLLWQLWRWNTEWDLTYLETYSDLFGNLFWLIWKPITINHCSSY